jgi:hypothetical protein
MDPLLGVATGVMAYYLWEHDDRNYDERPPGRTLYELVQRRIAHTPPCQDLYAGPDAAQKPLYHIPASKPRSTPQ